MPTQDHNPVTRQIALAAWAIIGVFVMLAIGVWLVIQAKVIVIPVVFALAIVYLLNPFVTGLQRFLKRRVISTVLAYFTMAVLIFGVGASMAPMLSEQTVELADQVPAIYERVTEWIASTGDRLGFEDVNLMTFDEVLESLTEPGFVLSDRVQEVAGTAFGLARGVLESLALVFVAPVIAFYILVDLPRLLTVAKDLLPPSIKEETIHVGSRLGRALGGFVRGQLLAATIVGLLSIIGYRVVGLELWLVIGVIAGALNMIPLLGPWVGGLLALSAALISGNLGLVVATGFVAWGVQVFDNNFVSPLVLRATVKLHPSIIILSLLLGGSLAGLLGVILAVPLAAVTKVLLGHYWRTRVLGEPWREAVEQIVEEPAITKTGEILVERIRARRDQDVRPGNDASPTFFDE